ncbi:MAG: hypothetical protein C4617_02000 [Candidatus Liberibacter europaeus]|uniref:Porin n=1 Tax=Candidatus Liberibacter europaeus TaxID=744859 RepID=A0A2T4VXW3_9HYPH|nr:MAG: hypothetical protein C4617_02000 [Candidatus Liberibacter europaeus]
MKLKAVLLGSSVIMSFASYVEAAPLVSNNFGSICGVGYSRVGSGSCVKLGGNIDVGGKYVRTADKKSLINPVIKGTFSLDTITGMPSGIPLEGSMKLALSESKPTGDFANLQLPVLDFAYIRYNGVKLGYYTPWDMKPYPGVNLMPKDKNMYSASYQRVVKRVKLGISADVLQVLKEPANKRQCGIGYMMSIIGGNRTFTLTGGYDIAQGNAVVRGVVSSKIGSNVLDFIGMWTSGESIYSNQKKYSVAASYNFDATSKLKINPALQYSFDNKDVYTVGFGAKFSYEISKALSASITAEGDVTDSDIMPKISISLSHSF